MLAVMIRDKDVDLRPTFARLSQIDVVEMALMVGISMRTDAMFSWEQSGSSKKELR